MTTFRYVSVTGCMATAVDAIFWTGMNCAPLSDDYESLSSISPRNQKLLEGGQLDASL